MTFLKSRTLLLLSTASILPFVSWTSLAAEEAPDTQQIEEPAAEVEDDADTALMETRQRIEQLEAAASLRQAELNERLAAVELERSELAAQQGLQEQRLAAELATMYAEQQRLAAQRELANAQREAQQAELRAQIDSQQLAQQLQQTALSAQQHALQLAQIELEKERVEYEKKVLQRDNELTQLDFSSRRIQTLLENVDAQNDEKDVVTTSLNYDVPLVDENGFLHISDRRIALNGPIIYGTAEYVEERINFFSNQNAAAPIFIVIDNCPGGSLMEGEMILRAMQASKAPVHVVVKGFAASMAAVIATNAPRSFAMPNTILLHHQPWTAGWGNVSEQSEQLALLKEWARRLHQTTADKMGLTIDAFYQRMYEETVTGDWQAFGDRAQNLQWVTDIVPVSAKKASVPDQPVKPHARGGGFSSPDSTTAMLPARASWHQPCQAVLLLCRDLCRLMDILSINQRQPFQLVKFGHRSRQASVPD